MKEIIVVFKIEDLEKLQNCEKFQNNWEYGTNNEFEFGKIDFENLIIRFHGQPERSKREDYNVTTINSYDCPKIEMPIDKDILTKYKWNSIDAVL